MTHENAAEAEASPVIAAGTDCESRSWSRCSPGSSKHEDFDKFLLRGLEAVQAEWALICTTHNITKLAKAI